MAIKQKSLPPKELRQFPESWVTNDVDEHDKIHALDAPHVRDTFAEEIAKKEQEPVKAKEKTLFDHSPEPRQLNQEDIDIIRLRVLSTCLDVAQSKYSKGLKIDFAVRHLWFPENDLGIYELRQGNPPAVSDRPQHLKQFALEIDIKHMPTSIIKTLESSKELMEKYNNEIVQKFNLKSELVGPDGEQLEANI